MGFTGERRLVCDDVLHTQHTHAHILFTPMAKPIGQLKPMYTRSQTTFSLAMAHTCLNVLSGSLKEPWILVSKCSASYLRRLKRHLLPALEVLRVDRVKLMEKGRSLIVLARSLQKVSSLILHPDSVSICHFPWLTPQERKCCFIGCSSTVASPFAALPVSCSNPHPATADSLGVVVHVMVRVLGPVLEREVCQLGQIRLGQTLDSETRKIIGMVKQGFHNGSETRQLLFVTKKTSFHVLVKDWYFVLL